MAINRLVIKNHEDEMVLADNYRDEKGTDWVKYILEKEKAGFGRFDQWYFIDEGHISVQLQSKYKYKWEFDAKVMFNARAAIARVIMVHNNRWFDREGLGVVRELALEGDEDKVMWTEDILKLFQPVGYGVNFRANVTPTVGACELIDIFHEKANIKIQGITVLWTAHDKLALFLHDDEKFA